MAWPSNVASIIALRRALAACDEWSMSFGDDLVRRRFLQTAASAAAVGLLGAGCGDDTSPAGTGGGDAADSTGVGQGGATGGTTTGGPGATTGGSGTSTGQGPATTAAGSGGSDPVGSGGSGQGAGGGTPSCEETEDDIEGPFYSEGAPIVDGALPGLDGLDGALIELSGRVFSAVTCVPLAGATLDLWQADDAGAYDNETFTLRGKVVTDAEGRYAVRTIVPGNYLNGAQYRPAHIHVKVSAPGHALLTTQLYFPDDPYNEIDPWFDERLLVSMSPGEGIDLAGFDFAIVPA
jgi:hypothetical protein